MPQVISTNSYSQEFPGIRIPSGTSRSSNEIALSALQSIQKLRQDTGTGEASKNLDQVAIHTWRGFYVGSLSTSARNTEEVVREELSSTLSEIWNLLTWSEGWNGYDAYALRYEAVQYAISWIKLFYQEVKSTGQIWIEPNVTASAEGEVVLEWRKGIKNLTVYISNETVQYVKDWGTDIDTEMEDGYINSNSLRHKLWQWLMN